MRQRGAFVRIEVTDTGVGVDPNETERIFEEFHRSPSQRQGTQRRRAGLGLSIVQRMAQALDHRGIELRSRPGRGSRFTIVAAGARR